MGSRPYQPDTPQSNSQSKQTEKSTVRPFNQLLVFQHNTARCSPTQQTLLNLANQARIDIILVQEPWIFERNDPVSYSTIQLTNYFTILPASQTRPRTATYIRKSSGVQFSNRTDLVDNPDLIILEIQEKNPFYLLNIYNEKDDQNQFTIERTLQNRRLDKPYLIAGDFNAHHSWWNSKITKSRNAKALIPWLKLNNGALKSSPDIPTFSRKGCRDSTLDLLFSNTEKASDWAILEEKSGSDHEIISFSISIQTQSLENQKNNQFAPYNFLKADWEKFDTTLRNEVATHPFFLSPEFTRFQNQNQNQSLNANSQSLNLDLGQTQFLDTLAATFTNIIQIAANRAIPKARINERSKPWWSKELGISRKEMSKFRRIWQQSKSSQDFKEFQRKKNSYFLAIKIAKRDCWNTYLEEATSKDVFRALNYTKRRENPILPSLTYQNANQQEQAFSFKSKCQAFLTTLFPTPPQTDSPQWKNYQESRWEWPKVSEIEIERAIFSSAKKKAPGPDKISFLILQKAYRAIPSLFHTVFKALVDSGYHPENWREAIGIALKKPNKPDYSNPKAYRIISLLNCLAKTSEKIIATRLGYLASTTNLLADSQIGGRVQNSALDTAMALMHEIESNQKKKEITSALFLDIKGAFDHVSRNRLLRICQKLGLPRSLCRWIFYFLSDRRIRLLFDNQTSETTQIEIGIPQGSPVSPILFLIYIRDLFQSQEDQNIKFLSYLDDLKISTSSFSAEKNRKTLEKIAKSVIKSGQETYIDFDILKTELIHFSSIKKLENAPIRIQNTDIWPKELVKWLGIYFDRTLSFKTHIQEKIVKSNRVFYRLKQLASTQFGLSKQALRQLYIACVNSVLDYGAILWFLKRKIPLEYQKIHKNALRQILGVFRTSPIQALEIEASLPPPEIRLSRLVLNYSKRIQGLYLKNPIQSLIKQQGLNFSLFEEECNQEKLDFSEKSYFRPGKKITQLERVTRLLGTSIPSLKNVIFPQKKIVSPWILQSLNLDLRLFDPETQKDDQKKTHELLIERLQRENRIGLNRHTILYTDGSKTEKGLGTGIFLTKQNQAFQQISLNFPTTGEVFDSELYGIVKGLELAYSDPIDTNHIWIFTDANSVIQKIQKMQQSLNLDSLLFRLFSLLQSPRNKAEVHIYWIPSHLGILGNEKADILAKKGTELKPKFSYLSDSWLKRQINEKTKEFWQQKIKVEALGRHYPDRSPKASLKCQKLPNSQRRFLSAFYQLKIAHGYFSAYFQRFRISDSSRCFLACREKQTPEHLLLSCQNYKDIRKELFRDLDCRNPTIGFLFGTKKGREITLEFIQRTKIGTRKWYLENTTE